MILETIALLFAAAAAGSSPVEEPRIGCWVEEQREMSRVLYGVPGNLVVRDEERTAECVTGEPGMLEEDAGLSLDASWTVFRLNDRWRIAVSGGTAYAYRRRGPGAWEKYEIPR